MVIVRNTFSCYVLRTFLAVKACCEWAKFAALYYAQYESKILPLSLFCARECNVAGYQLKLIVLTLETTEKYAGKYSRRY